MNHDHQTRDTPEERLKALGLKLPDRPPAPIARFRNVQRAGSLIYVSGQGPVEFDGNLKQGKVGRDVSAEEARGHAELVGLNILSAIREHLDGFERLQQIVKVLGMVNAVPDFSEHPLVINGCSDLFCEVLGERGAHARSAIGVGSLPNNITVEIEAIAEVKPR